MSDHPETPSEPIDPSTSDSVPETVEETPVTPEEAPTHHEVGPSGERAPGTVVPEVQTQFTEEEYNESTDSSPDDPHKEVKEDLTTEESTDG